MAKKHVFFFQFRFQKVIFFLIRLFLMAEHTRTLPSPAWNARTAESIVIMWPTKRLSKKIYGAQQYLLAISKPGQRQSITVISFLALCAEIFLFHLCLHICLNVSWKILASSATKTNSVKTLQILNTMNPDSLHSHCFFYHFLKHKALKVVSSHRPIGSIYSVVQEK